MDEVGRPIHTCFGREGLRLGHIGNVSYKSNVTLLL